MGKRLFLLISTLIIIAIIVIRYSPVIKANSDTVMITGNVVNVREQPGTSYSIITQLHKGETYQIEEHSSGWYQIKLPNGDKGWIADWLAEKQTYKAPSASPSKKGTVTVDALNVRAEPSLTGEVLGKLSKGDQVTVEKERNDWVRIQYKSSTAWISAQYVNVNSEQNVQASAPKNEQQISVLYDATNIRDKPALKSKILTQASAGTVYTIIEKKDDWYKIEYAKGKHGYIASWIVSHSTTNAGTKNDQYVTKSSNPLIVIDPGHGGRDQGATGANGSLEKDLTLNIANILAKKLYKSGYNVYITRTGDEYVSLQDRVYAAHQQKADAFISLHYDSIDNEAIKGHTTYYYHDSDKLLGQAIHKEIATSIQLKDRGVQYGNYYVLRENQQPSVLLELGFLSNSSEEETIRNHGYQEHVADSIVQGVINYFKN